MVALRHLLEYARVTIALTDNGTTTEIWPNQFGFLGDIKPQSAESVAAVKIGNTDIGMAFKLRVEIDDLDQGRVFAFTADKTKNVSPKANEFWPIDPEKSDEENRDAAANKKKILGNHKAYEIALPVIWHSKARCLVTVYPQNNLRLLVIDSNVVEEWEVSVTSQAGKFFLTLQRVYRWNVWKDGLTLGSFDDGLNEWPQMLKYIWHLFGTEVNNLPEYTDMLDFDDVAPRKRETEEKQGTVLWWNFAKGMGAVNTKYGVARAHWTQVASFPTQRYLVEGGTVQFKELAPPNADAVHMTKFKYDVMGVENI